MNRDEREKSVEAMMAFAMKRKGEESNGMHSPLYGIDSTRIEVERR